MAQKLITIPLDDDNEEDMTVREHLTDYLENDWKIIQMTSVGSGVGTGDNESDGYVAGWIAVLLEKV
ncbi:hypothetical protein [Candidatus Parabeggiatoa sp. HSG14]|uniref:hypothetical protein n=1 Tax=Candidatus Parabeggiatoa sp. HSG14 TaxID=3055593 RepID=UPI0025A810C2|nr:hypothetical protein [Thiotrichales bacterium HSG14]